MKDEELRYVLVAVVVFLAMVLALAAWDNHEKELTRREAIKMGYRGMP